MPSFTTQNMASFAMQYIKMIPSTSSLLSLYASFSTSMMLLRNVYNEIVPKQLQSFVTEKIKNYFSPEEIEPSLVTLIIDDSMDEYKHNELLDAARVYVPTKIGPSNKFFRISKFPKQKSVTTALVEGEEVIDVFEGIEIVWKYGHADDEDKKKKKKSRSRTQHEDLCFTLTFEDEYREKILNEYLGHVLDTYKELENKTRVLRLYTMGGYYGWNHVDMRHPATFDTLAMDFELKQAIKDDLDRFLKRRDFFRRVGKAWKRGYLLYGPPGTGKSSLVAAMAHYLNFDVYQLELSSVYSDASLRRALFDVNNKSIVVIEDIDCYSNVHDRSKGHNRSKSTGSSSSDSSSYSSDDDEFSLSTLLNCIDGLWSSCGEERIIVFTTNHKEVLDPALLRPGRMDMHIHMSYLTTQGFRVLALNYLGVQEHQLFEEIDELILNTEVTPAVLAEELMRSEDVDVALAGVVNFLKQKKMEKDNAEEEKKNKDEHENEKKNNVEKEKKNNGEEKKNNNTKEEKKNNREEKKNNKAHQEEKKNNREEKNNKADQEEKSNAEEDDKSKAWKEEKNNNAEEEKKINTEEGKNCDVVQQQP